jgi:hypothetical protein
MKTKKHLYPKFAIEVEWPIIPIAYSRRRPLRYPGTGPVLLVSPPASTPLASKVPMARPAGAVYLRLP